MSTKILVTGANGQLGKTIRDVCSDGFENLEFLFADRNTLDISKADEVASFFSTNAFDYCINCAAYTNVELAESEPERAEAINALAVGDLAAVCNDHDVVLIHISTDYVFDGNQNTPYRETDQTNPINVYGRSKQKGELLIKKCLTKHFIIRTSWLYSNYGHNFVKTICSRLENNDPIQVITSQRGTPTNCSDLAGFIGHIIRSKSTDYGTYHFSAQGETTWFEFAKEIALQLNYDDDRIRAIDTFKTLARRPLYSVLDNKKAQSLYHKEFFWKESLASLLKGQNK